MNIKTVAWAIAALFIAVLLGWVMVMEEKITTERDKNHRLESNLAETLASLAAMQADHTRTVAALETVTAAQQARAATLTQSIKEVDDAPKTDDGPVAPVLRRTLDGLRD